MSMSSRKSEKDHYWSKPIPDPEPELPDTGAEYELRFLDFPRLVHYLYVVKKKEHFLIKVKFTESILNPKTNTLSKGYEIQSRNLDELREIVKNFLAEFGHYNLKKV